MPYYYSPLFGVSPGGSSLPLAPASGDAFYLTVGAVGLYLYDGTIYSRNAWARIIDAPADEMSSAAAWGSITGTLADQTDLQSALAAKQAALVSATNIKTINGASVLGSGDLSVSGSAAWGAVTGTLSNQTDLQNALNAKGTSNFSGAYADLTGKPTLGTAAATAATDYATAAQGVTANSALQPGGNGSALTGLTKTQVGLGSVDNTSDAGKPVSTAQQTALDLKANLAGPTFTGTVSGITKAMVGLGSVDNTSDAGKPVSTAQQTALDLKATIAAPSFTGATLTLANAQDIVINATTGTKIGQSASKIGFFGVTPAVRPTTITQTYSTASATHANVTQLAAPAGGTGATAGAYNSAANRDLMITSVNAARTDIANVKQVLNQVIDQLQALGLLQ